MDFLLEKSVLSVLQIVVSIALMILILIQAKGVGLSGAFGGEGSFYRSKRGVEKIISNLTGVFATLFIVLSYRLKEV